MASISRSPPRTCLFWRCFFRANRPTAPRLRARPPLTFPRFPFAPQDGKEVYFKIRRSTPLRKLFGTYCTREGVDPNSVKFVVDGERLEDTSTPDSLDMENDDIIDVMQTMTGGQ